MKKSAFNKLVEAELRKFAIEREKKAEEEAWEKEKLERTSLKEAMLADSLAPFLPDFIGII